ncbi:MAG TPA: diguanylate cyclase [Burkholderiaceae bacterium]|nr:diguanylate cyclase [Burkholderiaceae bacterium]
MTLQGPNTQGAVQDSAQRADTKRSAVSSKPRILLIDAGRISRGPAGDVARQQFDVREVTDAETAWQAVLLDSAIRVLIVELTAPAVRGWELLARLRASKVQRIRELPAVALLDQSSAGESQRVEALEATALILGDPPAPNAAGDLLSRVRVLVELASTREALVESRSELDSARTVDPETELLTLPAFDRQVDKLLSYARRALSDLSLICIRVELKMPHSEAWDGEIEQRMRHVGRTLSSSVRLEDLATRSDRTEFCVATQNNGMTDMLRFAARLRKVLENVDAAGPGVEVWTCIGVATLSEELRRNAGDLRSQAQRRAQMAQSTHSRRIMLGASEAAKAGGFDPHAESGSMDVNLALALIGSGRAAEVVAHIPRLLEQLNPLLRLIRQQQNPPSANPSPGTEKER